MADKWVLEIAPVKSVELTYNSDPEKWTIVQEDESEKRLLAAVLEKVNRGFDDWNVNYGFTPESHWVRVRMIREAAVLPFPPAA